MRGLIRLIVVLAVLWSAWWLVSAYGLRHSLAGWFDTQRELGWQADYAEIQTSGYPFRHITRLELPALADPATGTAWRADWISFDSPAAWPGRQTLRFADTPQTLSYLDRTDTVVAQALTADLDLRPGLALQLRQMALTAGPWAVASTDGSVLQAQSLIIDMQQAEDPSVYNLIIAADSFSPSENMRRLSQTAQALPATFETLTLEMQVRFDRPWDRRALEESRPQPQEIILSLADAQWGALRLQAAGRVTVDAEGVPDGSITIKADNWREMLAIAQATGRMPESALEPANRVLGLLAGLGGNPNALDVKLNLRDGFVALGPVPVGPAPRLILR